MEETNRPMELPTCIREHIVKEDFQLDDVGMSASTIMLFEDKVLKIQDIAEESETEYQVMEWLKDRLPVPQVLAHATEGEKDFLLMSKLSGKMSCDESYMENPLLLTEVLAEGLKMLWNVDVSECPFCWNLDRKLAAAKYNVENGLVDVDNVEPETFGENGFRNPAHLLEWLIENRPAEELVLVHGDYCLPNIFVKDGKVSGFLDLGKTGLADKWQDIALCYRSLLHNYEGKYGGKAYEGFEPGMLFEKLGIEPDWEKIRYYILMDELF